VPETTPILAPPGRSAAMASQPDTPLEGERYHSYEANAAPWWISVLWLAFFTFAFTYLMLNIWKLG
jgi:hypothetical protein